MNSYKTFAKFYDILMKEDINYNKICDFIENLFVMNDIAPELVCDLACGTGNITIPMANRGYDMIGIDNSYDMLDIARSKTNDLQNEILFLNQNITKLDLYGTVDAFLCMIDGFNYILQPNNLFRMFKKIKTCFINPNGLFIFDISSFYKLSKYIGNNTFIHDDEKIFYSWENKYHEDKKISDMNLNFFIKKDKGYQRFCERHLQRAYSIEEITKMLKLAGFTEVSVYDGYSFNKPKKTSQRIVFCAK